MWNCLVGWKGKDGIVTSFDLLRLFQLIIQPSTKRSDGQRVHSKEDVRHVVATPLRFFAEAFLAGLLIVCVKTLHVPPRREHEASESSDRQLGDLVSSSNR